MKYVRTLHNGQSRYGIIEDQSIRLLENTPFDDEIHLSETLLSLTDARLLAPTAFSKAICIGLNYLDHAQELDLPLPESPVVFLKPSTSILGAGEPIIYPAISERVDYEAELCVVIKKEARHIKAEEADSYILGYSCANDVTARDLQPKQGQWTIAKGFDTFCPYGPFVSDEVDPANLSIECRLDGKVMQASNTRHLIFDIPYLVSYLSQIMTLLPGDIILTGTPGGIGPMKRGQEVEVLIEGLGILSNPVT